MTVSAQGLAFYAAALALLWLTPGPVWVAIGARALAGGFRAAWPLALGVAIGDMLWALAGIFGLSLVVSRHQDLLVVLRWVAAAIFIAMGLGLIRQAGRPPARDGRPTRPGFRAGFSAGIAAILGNPKAILFYMGVLPGFFDLTRLAAADVAAICALSAAVPLAGNLALAAAISRARAVLATPRATRRMHRIAGVLLIAVGLAIPLL